jgi:hypothetical protein
VAWKMVAYPCTARQCLPQNSVLAQELIRQRSPAHRAGEIKADV